MRNSHVRFLVAALLVPAGAGAQEIHVTPLIGAYTQASDFEELRGDAETIRATRESALALGLNVELGALRASIAYASDATLQDDGVENRDRIGTASLLAASADLVLRPIPRIFGVQPYALGGVGLKRAAYSYERDGFGDAFPEDDSDVGAHLGLGADFMFGRLGLTAEVSDYLTRSASGDWDQHDAFGMVGLRLRI